MIKDKDVHVINSKNRDNYMDKELSDDEDTIIGDDKIKFRNNSSVKDAINNSIDYLKKIQCIILHYLKIIVCKILYNKF